MDVTIADCNLGVFALALRLSNVREVWFFSFVRSQVSVNLEM